MMRRPLKLLWLSIGLSLSAASYAGFGNMPQHPTTTMQPLRGNMPLHSTTTMQPLRGNMPLHPSTTNTMQTPTNTKTPNPGFLNNITNTANPNIGQGMTTSGAVKNAPTSGRPPMQEMTAPPRSR